MAMTEEERKSRDCKWQKVHYAVHKDDPAFKAANYARVCTWTKLHHDHVKQKSRKWYRANRERVLKAESERRKVDPKCVAHKREYDRQRRIEHPELAEREKVRLSQYYECHREEVIKRAVDWNRTNTEKNRTYSARYCKANPEKNVVNCSKHRALKYANTPISEMLTSAEWLAILAEANGHCHYCDKEAKLSLDHVIPLSKGGKHSGENVVPACKHCNSSKSNKTLEEWNKVTRAQLEAARG
jgi:5-methylcytosine-specific restriction endonuclease McrA